MAELVWRAGSFHIDCSARTRVMGIINITPDSFSDGGRFFDPEVAVAAGMRMVADGADLLDVGGESTRPGARFVPPEEERDRVVPVLKRLAAEVPDVPLSIDTRKASVAAAALDGGASIVNDVTGGRDPEMFPLLASSDAGVVLMHMRGEPDTMQSLTEYDDVVEDVKAWLAAQVDAAVAAGIARERLAIDPGLGFAKTTPQSLVLIRENERLLDLGRPVVVGPSRKSFVGHATGTDIGDRVEGTAGAVAWLAAHGAHVVRVHDVRAMIRVVRMVGAIRRGSVDRR